jgi:Cft2 family RNA processing exonuclease
VFYTSDTSVQPQTILPEADFPDAPVDVLILESTLGADPEAAATTRKAEERRFGETIAAVVARGGATLIPVFALGRSQDVLAMIDRAKRRGTIPADTPVYTAGSMRAVAEIYDRTRESSPRLDPDFEVFDVEQQRLPRTQVRMNEALSQAGIFVVSSGMLFERTPAYDIAERLVSDPKHAVLFVGFSKEGSPGDVLQKAALTGGTMTFDPLKGPVPVQATVGRFRFSGHANRDDLVGIVGRLSPETVVLVHGETAAKEWMRATIGEAYPDVRVVIPEQGVEVEL